MSSYPKINRENNFDFLRFFAASGVFFSHAFPLSGIGEDPFGKLSGHLDTLGGLCVSIFFIISGFLVSSSWCREPHLGNYLKKRALRIFPGLIVTILLTVFLFGPLITKAPINEYFQGNAVINYLGNMVLYTHHTNLPGVFTDNPLPHTINGSLWTLPVEFSMYVLVAGLGIAGLLTRTILPYVILFIFVIFSHIVSTNMYWMGGTIPVYYAIKHALSFACGMLLYLHYDKLPTSPKVFYLAVIATFASLYTPYAQTVIILTLPYIIIYLAFADIPFIKHFGKYGDFSYGIYIYAFPIQQYYYWLFKETENFSLYLAASYVTILGLAVLSWHLVEKPFLSFKHMSFRKGALCSS